MSQELFERYRCDRDRRTYERLVEEQRPLVSSVCRRMLRDPNDVEDVVQETFLKLAGHIDEVNESLSGWLMATARAASANLIRREIRERNRRLMVARSRGSEVEQLAAREAIRLRLHEAMLLIEPSAREILIERFVHQTPLGTLAVRMKYSVPTASRRVVDGLRQLAKVLRDLGIPTDDQTVADHFAGGSLCDDIDESDHGALRFAPDWRCAELTPLGCASPASLLPGWSRPMRVGILISYQSTRTLGINKVYVGTKWQVHSTSFIPPTGIQPVAIVEPGTVHRGVVESTLRDYGIVGGLIEADDATALATLDVILIGINYTMSPNIARAINRAVRGGVGLLNEYWISHTGMNDDPSIRELMLADSDIHKYHTRHLHGTCASPLPATVEREHRLLPGLRAGSSLQLRGCGPVYRVMPTAQVLITKDALIQPHEHSIAGAGPLRMPCYILGQLGRGRVAVVHAWPHQWFSQNLNVSSESYYVNLLQWLAGSHG
jgi:RNA polymerase sigma-70 factor (ECF subfamily)